MKKVFSRVAIILLISLFVVNAVAWAGSGDGSGGGKDKPVELVTSTIKDGAKDVALNAKIRLEFSKNITFETVRVANQKAFSMVDKDGKPVDINVILAEPEDRDERNFVNIEPKGGLKGGQQYTLKIAKNLQSKSGDNLEKPIEISFSTVAAGKDKNPVDSGKKSTKNPKTSDSINNYIVVSLAVILILAYKGYGVFKEKAN